MWLSTPFLLIDLLITVSVWHYSLVFFSRKNQLTISYFISWTNANVLIPSLKVPLVLSTHNRLSNFIATSGSVNGKSSKCCQILPLSKKGLDFTIDQEQNCFTILLGLGLLIFSNQKNRINFSMLFIAAIVPCSKSHLNIP